jgi:arsenite methyltransferase
MVATYERPELRKALEDVLHPGGQDLTGEVLAACALPPQALVADLGCGAGVTAAHLRDRYGLTPIGIDTSSLLLAGARRRASDLAFVHARAERLPVAGGVFDAVLAECSLSTMPQRDTVLAELVRALKRGGRLALTDMYMRDTSGESGARQSCSGPMTRDETAAALVKHGLVLAAWRDRSDTLKLFAARLIMAGIPLASLGCDCGPGIGYCWLVARKT